MQAHDVLWKRCICWKFRHRYSVCAVKYRRETSFFIEKKHAGETDSQPVLKTNAAFYWARELVFTRNKLIVFTTSREPSHYVVFSWKMADRKVGVVLKSTAFFLFMCMFLYFYFFTNRVSTYLAFEKWDKYTFWSNKKHWLPFALTTNLYIWMSPIFIV